MNRRSDLKESIVCGEIVCLSIRHASEASIFVDEKGRREDAKHVALFRSSKDVGLRHDVGVW